PPPLDRPAHPLDDRDRARRYDRERPPDLRGLRQIRKPRRSVLREPVRRRTVPALEPARRMARGRAQLALRTGLAAHDLRSPVSRLPRTERRVARPAVPAAGRSGHARDDEVLPPSPQGPPAPGQAPPAANTRL